MEIRNGQPWLSEEEFAALTLAVSVLHRIANATKLPTSLQYHVAIETIQETLEQCAVGSWIQSEWSSPKYMLELLGPMASDD